MSGRKAPRVFQVTTCLTFYPGSALCGLPGSVLSFRARFILPGLGRGPERSPSLVASPLTATTTSHPLHRISHHTTPHPINTMNSPLPPSASSSQAAQTRASAGVASSAKKNDLEVTPAVTRGRSAATTPTAADKENTPPSLRGANSAKGKAPGRVSGRERSPSANANKRAAIGIPKNAQVRKVTILYELSLRVVVLVAISVLVRVSVLSLWCSLGTPNAPFEGPLLVYLWGGVLVSSVVDLRISTL